MKLVVHGEPKGKERPRFSRMGKYVRTYTPEKTTYYEQYIKTVYKNQYGLGVSFASNEILYARIYCFYSIPKRTGKEKRRLMKECQVRPKKKPDADNIVKIVLDALNGTAYHDDAQIVDCVVRKFYSDNPRVEIWIDKCKEFVGVNTDIENVERNF